MQLQAKKTKDRCPLLEATEQKRTFYQFSGRAWNKKNKWKQKEARLRVTPILFISAPSKIPHLILVVGEGNGTPLQYSCLENPMDGGAWWAAVHGVAKSWAQLSDFTFNFHFPELEKEMVTHSSVLAWRIPGMGEPGGLLSMGSHRVGYDWSDLAVAVAILVVVVQLLSHVQLFATPWTAVCQVSLSFTISQSLLRFLSIESVMSSNHLILCHPLLLLPSIFPRIRAFSLSRLSHQVATVLKLQHQSLNIQDGFCLGLTGLISLQSKELSRVFSRLFVLTFFMHVHFTFNKT